MKLALHRSMTFWSGLLAIAFICWAWRESYRQRSLAGGHSYSISQTAGMIAVCYDPETWGSREFEGFRVPGMLPGVSFEWTPAPYFLRGKGDHERPPVPLHAETIRENTERWWAERSPKSWLLGIPHWLLQLVFVLAWVGALIWRARPKAFEKNPKLASS